MIGQRYIEVILPNRLPARWRGGLTYRVPEGLDVESGSWVVVTLVGRRSLAIVSNPCATLPEGIPAEKILPIEKVVQMPPLPQSQIEFWKAIAGYYMCSVGEVFKCACPTAFFRQTEKTRTVNRASSKAKQEAAKELSEAQQLALNQIKGCYSSGKRTVLLAGATSSGKTEIYLKLAAEQLEKGHNVLYLVPEIALSRQLEQRLRGVVGEKLLVFHSKQTAAARKKIFDRLLANEENWLVLGTRSALLLPISKPGLIIVDEEHDQSYKQNDPAPRYNGRDAALMLAAQEKSLALLGSATPSLESLHNAQTGKYGLVTLKEKYFGAADASVSIIDMNKVYRLHNAKGSFSMQLVNMIAERLQKKEQVMVFRSRRSYSSFVQCDACGEVLKCPKCSVSLSYHKYNNSCSCHYCGYRAPFAEICGHCGSGHLTPKGAGTEKLVEELQELFPEASIARFDAETIQSRAAEKEILAGFESGSTDILVGTQMITKGFDFDRLSLVAVVNADSILSLQDFRADEKALDLLLQLKGRASRRGTPGQMAIQTMMPDHPVLQAVCVEDFESQMSASLESLQLRELLQFPPYVRIIQITIKSRSPEDLRSACTTVGRVVKECGIAGCSQPIVPAVDRIDGMYIRHLWIKMAKTSRELAKKGLLYNRLEELREQLRHVETVVDVDPL